MEGGSNAVATTFGNLGMVARKYAHKIPFIVKLNHNELLTYPTKYNQIMFGSVDDAWNLGRRCCWRNNLLWFRRIGQADH